MSQSWKIHVRVEACDGEFEGVISTGQEGLAALEALAAIQPKKGGCTPSVTIKGVEPAAKEGA